MRLIIIWLGLLIAGCSGGNQGTETGGGMSQSVKYPDSSSVQVVSAEQPASQVNGENNGNAHLVKRKMEQSRRYSPPYP
jgi:hypothetical protein